MIHGRCSPPLGVIFRTDIWCFDCWERVHLSSTSVVDPFFTSTEWGYNPICCRCSAMLMVILAPPPRFALPAGAMVVNTELKSNHAPCLGQIIEWAFGSYPADCSYKVRREDDGAIKIWHRSDIKIPPKCLTKKG